MFLESTCTRKNNLLTTSVRSGCLVVMTVPKQAHQPASVPETTKIAPPVKRTSTEELAKKMASEVNPLDLGDLLNALGPAANHDIRNARSSGEATAIYWDVLQKYQLLRKNLLKGWELAMRDGKFRDEMLEVAAKGTWMEGGVRNQAEPRRVAEAALIMVWLSEKFDNDEASAVVAIEVSKVDQRMVGWASDYVAWLRKDAVHKTQLFNSISHESQSSNDAPVAFGEALIRYSLGDSNFSTAWDQQRLAQRRASDAMRECETMGLELDKEAAQLSADCMKLRAALSREYGTEFGAISVP